MINVTYLVTFELLSCQLVAACGGLGVALLEEVYRWWLNSRFQKVIFILSWLFLLLVNGSKCELSAAVQFLCCGMLYINHLEQLPSDMNFLL